MNKEEFLKKLKTYAKLFHEEAEIANADSINREMKEDGMLRFRISQLNDSNEGQIIDKQSYISEKLGKSIILPQNMRKKNAFIPFIIGVAFFILGFVAKFYIGIGVGVIALLLTLKVINNNKEYNNNKKLYEQNKEKIEKLGQEYDKLKIKWLKLIKEYDQKVAHRSETRKQREALEAELWKYVEELGIPTTSFEITTLLILHKCIEQHNGDFDEAMDDYKEEIKRKLTKDQCKECARRDFCGDRDTVYNCSNFVMEKK